MLFEVLKLAVGPLTSWLTHKKEIKKIKTETQLAVLRAESQSKIRRAENQEAADINLDLVALKTRGWKDEYLLVIGTVPLVLSFIPDMQPYVKEGFKALAETPEWYWYLLAGLFIDTLGFRSLLRGIIDSTLQKRLKK
ncbi:hypothetical protein [Pleionea sp. CnH1-48]|uniref:hypothetical protein n=1 Tax=Pleionea sp. CnH1-48 TaxID=2954494 RepID=UPI002097A9AE|nr:hypothetical protein [Pleionea sp. CnH1-48]MCO7226000.1 hypothetical protein [Pleionea sp. CnH1-48]